MYNQEVAIVEILEAASRVTIAARTYALTRFKDRQTGMPQSLLRQLDIATAIVVTANPENPRPALDRLAHLFQEWKLMPGDGPAAMALFDLGYALHPLALQLMNMLHLTRAYPRDVCKRAQRLDPKQAIEKAA